MRPRPVFEWSPAAIDDALRKCHEAHNRPITMADYRRWRSSLDEPSTVPYERHIGRIAAEFVERCIEAGVPAEQRSSGPLYTERRVRWSTSQLLDALRRCADETGQVPTLDEYTEWRTALAGPGDVPGGASFTLRSRRFADLIQQAGLKPRRRRGTPDEEVWNSIHLAIETLGPNLSRRHYEEFRRRQPVYLLSASQLERRTRLGWSSLLLRALECTHKYRSQFDCCQPGAETKS